MHSIGQTKSNNENNTLLATPMLHVINEAL